MMGLNIFRAKDAKSFELQAAIETIDLTVLDAEIDAAASARQAALLDGTDKEIADAEKRLADARLNAERGRARHAELTRRLAEANAREARETLAADHAKISKSSAALAARLDRDYRRIAGELVKLLGELDEAEHAAKAMNDRLGEAGEAAAGLDPIPCIEGRAIPFAYGGRHSSILFQTKLRELRTPVGHLDTAAPNWPPNENWYFIWR